MSQTTILTKEAKKQVINNKKLRIAIFSRWEIFSLVSLQRWCMRDDPRLVHPDTIALITAHAGMESGIYETVTREDAI